MIRWLQLSVCGTILALFMLVAGSGCTSPKKDPTAPKDKTTKTDKTEHGHGERGPRGGVLAEWDPYHGELIVDHSANQATVYILSDDVKKAPEEAASRFSKVRLVVTSEKPSVTIDFAHDAKKSDAKGIAFTATNDLFGKAAAFKGNLSMMLDENDKKKAKPFADDIEFEPKKQEGKTN